MNTTTLLASAFAFSTVVAAVAVAACGRPDVAPQAHDTTNPGSSRHAYGVGPFSSPPWDTSAPPSCQTDAQCEYAATFPTCAALPGTVRGKCAIAPGAEYGTCVDDVAAGCSAAKGCDECNVTCSCDTEGDDAGTAPDAGDDGGSTAPGCGDQTCDGDEGEDCTSCPSDCGTCGQCEPGKRYCAVEGICKDTFRCPNPGAFRYGGFQCCYQVDPVTPGVCYLYLPPQNVYTCETPQTCGTCSIRRSLCSDDSECDDADDTTVDKCDFTERNGYCSHATDTTVVVPAETCATCDVKTVLQVSASGAGVVRVKGGGIDSACRSDVCFFDVDPDATLTLTSVRDSCTTGGGAVWTGACTSEPCTVRAVDRKVTAVNAAFP